MSQLEIGSIVEDIWDITREDCARSLEEEARRIRTGLLMHGAGKGYIGNFIHFTVLTQIVKMR